MIKNNNKGNVSFILGTILITLLTFFVYINFFVLATKNVSDSSEDLMCRSLVASKDLSVIKLGEFFYQLNYKCHKDFIKNNDVKTKEEMFDVVAEAQKRCWYRFGEGKYDFMGNLNKDGFWCFECGQLDFSKSDIDEVSSYLDYVEYLKTKKLKVDKNETTYYEYMNLKYANSESTEKMYKIKEDIDELMKDGDVYFKDLGQVYNEQYLYLGDLLKKELNPNEKIYVVYRYDKPTEDISDKITSATYTGLGTAAGTMVAAFAVEKAILYSATLVSCGGAVATAGLATPICALMLAKSVQSTIKTVDKVTGISKIYNRVKNVGEFFQNSIKFSKNTKKLIKIFAGTVEELEVIGEDINKVDPELGVKILENSRSLKSKNINHIDDIEKAAEEYALKADNINKLFDENWEMLNSNALNRLIGKQDFYLKQREELLKLGEEVKTLEKTLSNMNPEETKKFYQKKAFLIKGTIALVAGAGGAIVGANLNFNDNQYVDVLTEEQYYRLCGTQSFDDK